MNALKLKAKAKKQKYFDKNNYDSTDDSCGELTDEDELEVSKDYVYKIYNNKYLCIKYLGRGTFSRVWLVLDIFSNKFYAMKTFFPKYNDDSKHEIDVNTKLKNITPNYVLVMEDSFLNNETNEMCIITKLLGKSVNDLLDFDNDNENEESNSEEDISENSNYEESSSEEEISENSNYEESSSEENNYSNKENSKIPIFKSPNISLVKKFIRDISAGLYELHSKNMIHTDLKFENVLIDILDDDLKLIIDKIKSLKICEKFQKLIEDSTPANFENFDKVKKKKVKRKNKIKSIKLLVDYLKQNKLLEFDYKNTKTNMNMNIYDLENINYDSFKFIIIDLGNVEYINERIQDEIMMRNYRPPENIISDFYDCKADMWSLGCLTYEIITNNYLFDIDGKDNSINRDRKHLKKMYNYLGKMPKEMTVNCQFSKDLFDSKGNILKYKKYKFTSIEELLIEECSYKIETIKEITNFLNKLFVYEPKNRLSSQDCYDLTWLKHNQNIV